VETIPFETRRACPSDADAIAAAHQDSIHSLGALFYSPEVVAEWGAGLTQDNRGDIYVRAMDRGEIFYIAVGRINGELIVLGFASHRVEASQHRTAVYVRGAASRRGIGSALFRLAEADAIATGGTSIHVDASLAAVEFYQANGFQEVDRGEHRLKSGRLMPCVFMRKDLMTPRSIGA
jgi:ribosomal protein S18 acetylase RimI-like enzyme